MACLSQEKFCMPRRCGGFNLLDLKDEHAIEESYVIE